MVSSAPGEQGFVNADQENEYTKKMNAAPTAVLLDPKGDLGHLYGAKTTPHMFVIDREGKLIYEGANDDRATTEVSDVNGAVNCVTAALQESMAGKVVTTASTRAYGCSVKYVR